MHAAETREIEKNSLEGAATSRELRAGKLEGSRLCWWIETPKDTLIDTVACPRRLLELHLLFKI